VLQSYFKPDVKHVASSDKSQLHHPVFKSSSFNIGHFARNFLILAKNFRYTLYRSGWWNDIKELLTKVKWTVLTSVTCDIGVSKLGVKFSKGDVILMLSYKVLQNNSINPFKQPTSVSQFTATNQFFTVYCNNQPAFHGLLQQPTSFSQLTATTNQLFTVY
jgi:hypothetical protein